MEQHDLYVRENFGRHHMATHLSSFNDYSFRDVQLFLGHSLGFKTNIYSETDLPAWMKKTRRYIEEIIKKDGWKIINGLPKNTISKLEWSESIISKRQLAQSFLNDVKPGHINRNQRNKGLSDEINIVSQEIKNYIEKFLKNKLRNRKIENQILKKLIGLDFPHHTGWKKIRNRYKNEDLENSPIASILKKFQFELANSSINPLFSNQIDKNHSTSNLFIDWLNDKSEDGWLYWVTDNKKEFNLNKLHSTLVISAAIFSNLSRVDSLSSLIDQTNFRTNLYKTDENIYLEFLKTLTTETASETSENNHWIDRWHPDGFDRLTFRCAALAS